MPLLNYACSCGKVQNKYFKSAKDAPSVVKCECGLEARKGFGATSSSHKIVIDNGLMAKAVELQSSDIMEINASRSAKNYSEED